MFFRRLVLSAGLILLGIGFAGPTQNASAEPAAPVLARVHWRGLDQIRANTNSAHFMAVWQLPQTQALLAQTLDKISRLPGGGATNATSARLRPLLDDFIAHEFYLELSAPTNSQLSTLNSQLAFALRLPSARAHLWQTNLSAALTALSGVHPQRTPDGWLWERTASPQRIEFSRQADWIFIGIGLEKSLAQTDFVRRLARESKPRAHADWLTADLNLPDLADFVSLSARRTGGAGRGEVGLLSTLNLQPSTFFTTLHLTVRGDAGNLLTRATLDFSHALALALPPWEIPTNFIHAPLASFTAVRGIAGWLARLPAWQKLHFAPPPDQACLWSQTGAPFLTYLACPLPAARNQLSHLAGHLVENANAWMAVRNADGRFQAQTNPPGISSMFPIVSPVLKSVRVGRRDYLLAGLFPLPGGNANPPPPEIIRAVRDTPKLVYYENEHTRLRLNEVSFVTQLFRIVFNQPARSPQSPITAWLAAINPALGDTTTVVTWSHPAQLTLTRNSTIGFNALELLLLADWLESPQFPHGLHTLLAPPDK